MIDREGYGDCPVCRISRRVTAKGVMVRHNGPGRSRERCAGTGEALRPLARRDVPAAR